MKSQKLLATESSLFLKNHPLGVEEKNIALKLDFPESQMTYTQFFNLFIIE